MKKVLLDHCVPRPLRRLLAHCTAWTAEEKGWAKYKNGALLAAAENDQLHILITADKTFVINKIWARVGSR